MGTYVVLACMVVLSCLLHSVSSAHKNKIIVKVPHVVKHVHHNHFKPIHVHKVRTKKIEHHYQDDHEDTHIGGKHGKRNPHKGNKKLHGSFSNLKPILLHQQIQEHMEYPGEMHEFNHKQRVGHRLEFDRAPRQQQFSQEDNFWKPEDRPAKRRPKFRDEGFNRGEILKRDHTRLKPIDFSNWLNEDDKAAGGYSGETWDIPVEDFSQTRNRQRKPVKKQFSNNEHKNKRAKYLDWRSKEVSSEMESNGWRPMVDFNAWNNFNDMETNCNGNHNNQFIDSGEYMTALNDDYNQSMQEEITESTKRKKRKQSRKKNQNKQIEGLDQNGNHEQVNKKLPHHPYQLESPPSPVLPQIQPQFFQPLQTPQMQPYSIPLPEAQRAMPQLNWPPQQHPGSVWQTQAIPQPQPQPTSAPKVVWSGHHLQMPQHSMWHVQQHSDGAPPLQALTVNQNPLQAFQFHQHHSLPQQLTQESSPVHQVVPPGWPLTQKSQDSSVKQHWEQHVQTSGSDGPASSYRVEVINYTDKKKAR